MLDVKKIRQDFDIYKNSKNLVYLDSSASSLKVNSVINKLDYYYKNYGVNIHRGVYQLSYDATLMYDESRNYIAKFINALEDEVIFTRGTTNSINMLSIALRDFLSSSDEVVTSILEHHSCIIPFMENERRKHGKLIYIPLNDEKRITLDNFKNTITKNTKVIVLAQISNTMGYLIDVKQMIIEARKINPDVIVIIDGAQSIGHMKVDVKDLDCDFFAFSAHKMMGPTGIGILYGKRKWLRKIRPIEYGGDMTSDVSFTDFEYFDAPQKFEAGTPIIAEAIAFKEAVLYLEKIGYENIRAHERQLMNYTIPKLQKIKGVTIYNINTDSGIILFNINNVHPHDAASIFDKNNVCLRAGHHCALLITKDLKTMFNATLRASFYIYNDLNDCDIFLKSVEEAVKFFNSFEVK